MLENFVANENSMVKEVDGCQVKNIIRKRKVEVAKTPHKGESQVSMAHNESATNYFDIIVYVLNALFIPPPSYC